MLLWLIPHLSYPDSEKLLHGQRIKNTLKWTAKFNYFTYFL